jgi:cell envelope-related function transcriptional attenuator common domain
LRVLKWIGLVAVCLVVAAVGALGLWLQHTAAQVAHNDPAEVKAAKQQLSPVLPSGPVNILIIGSDRRVHQADVGARSDTLMVVRLDPQTNSISMLSVPRDLRVDIPGFGLNKINAAYSLGGAKLTVETVKQLLGVPINDFIDVNFEGFIKVVDKLGGAYLMVDHRYYNNTAVTNYASIDIQPGYQVLNGHQALSFVRFRHDQNGDFTRIVRQQMFLREMKRELAGSATITSFPHLFSVATIMSHYAVSDIASLSKIYGLVTLGLKLDTNHIYQAHITGTTPSIGGVSYVVATPQDIAAGVQEFLSPVSPQLRGQSKASVSQLPRSQVKITVLNGSGRAGAAAAVAAQLQTRGYVVAVGGNAANFGYTTTTVSASSAGVSVARGLAGLLAPAQLKVAAGQSVATGHVIVTVGSSYSGQLVVPAASASGQSPQAVVSNAPHDAAQWQALRHQTPIALAMPTAWSPGLGYDQFRAYRCKTGHGTVPAAVVVGTTPQGGYWDVQALRWTNPPILASPDTIKTIGAHSYSLYYDGAKLRMVAWRVGGTAYWVSNTLDEELSNPLMLALATSCAAVH